MNREYRLYLSPVQKVLLVVPLLAVLVVIGVMLATSGEAGETPLPAGILFIAVMAYVTYFFLSTPHRIEVDEAERVTFVSLLRRLRVTAGDIRSIHPRATHFGFFVVEHTRGRTNLLAQFDDFHVFLTDLQTRNPRVELRGC